MAGGGLNWVEGSAQKSVMPVGISERELGLALDEQARHTTGYERSIGTTAQMSAYARLRETNRRVSSCDRQLRQQRVRDDRFEFSFPADAMAPRHARKEVADRLRGRVDLSVAKTVELLVSETVTNAVTHGTAVRHATVDVEGRLLPGRIRIEVTNCGPAVDHVPELPPATDPDGRGLFLVDQMARAWGAEHAATATRVWFEIAA